MYEKTKKQALGEAIADFMADRSLWPKSLKTYWTDLPYNRKRAGKGLTIELMLDWMAIETGIPEFTDEFYRGSFEKLLTRYRQWSYNPDVSAGDNFALFTAIAHYPTVRDEDGNPIETTDGLIAFLFGRKPPG